MEAFSKMFRFGQCDLLPVAASLTSFSNVCSPARPTVAALRGLGGRLFGVIAEDVPNRTLRTGRPKPPANRGFASTDFAGVSRAVIAWPKRLVSGRPILSGR